MPIFFVLDFQLSHFLWLVFSLLLGLSYAAWLYPRRRQQADVSPFGFFVLRAVCVALICFLLFAPQVSSRKRTHEKPLILLVQDNSASLRLGTIDPVKSSGYKASLKRLYDQLAGDYRVDTLLLGDSLRSGFTTDLQDKTSDISSLFQGIRDRYAGRNVGAVILASDGLYNRGGDPLLAALSLKVPLYTIALGDTAARRDLLVSNVNYNELVQAGNRFEASILVEARGSRGQRPKLAVYRGKEMVFSRVLSIDADDFRREIQVVLPEQRPGMVRYTVRIDSVPGEVSVVNNARDVYVEAQDLRKKVLILSDAPHPDIAAIRQSLSAGKTYEAELAYIDDVKTSAVEKADLIILYQLPSKQHSLQTISGLIRSKPVFYVLGGQSDLRAFSAMQGMLRLTPATGLTELSAVVNTSFPAFTLSDSTVAAIPGLGPLSVPFSGVQFRSGRYDLLYQDGGSRGSNRPLFSFSVGQEPRLAVLAAEGIWRWRLEAFNSLGSSNVVDQLLTKAVQYLVANADRRRFRVYPSQQVYTEGEPVTLNAELFNEALELVNTAEVLLTLRGGGQVYSYQFTRVNNSYMLNPGALPAGEYTYKATTQLGQTTYAAEGSILISSNPLELQETRANHQLLYQLAAHSGGNMLHPEQTEELYKEIKGSDMVKTVTYENVTANDVIDVKWLFAIICLLLFCEWFLRKRSGKL